MGYGTQENRTDVGCKSTDIFIYHVVVNNRWTYDRLMDDLYNQLNGRLNNPRLAADIKGRVEQWAGNRIKSFVLDKLKELSKGKGEPEMPGPTLPAELAKGMLGGLATMAFWEDDAGHDCNRYRLMQDTNDYCAYLTYTYTSRGRVQPKYKWP